MAYKEVINEIDEIQAAIQAHGPLAIDVLKKVNYKFRLEWNYTSNSMEGNSLTRSETRSVMIGNITVHGKPIKDVLEMKGHVKIISTILNMGKGDLQQSEQRIREIHSGIMHEEDPEKVAHIGKWKPYNNHVINNRGEKHEFTPHEEVPDAMHRLTDWLAAQREKIARGESDAQHPAILAFGFHLKYVSIHPFYDGNGRTARILTNIILIAYGYPPIWIREEERNAYYQYLSDVQSYGGDSDVFNGFMADLLVRSQKLVLNAVEGKDIEEPSDYLKELDLVKRKLANETIPKSPKIVYQTFLKVQKDVWKPLESLLNSFDDLFNESNDYYKVDNRPQKYETEMRSVIPTFERIVSKAPNPITIYGHDIYKIVGNEISWEQKKYALKGSSTTMDFSVVVTLSFSHLSYTLSISATGCKDEKTMIKTKIIDLSKQYSQTWNEEEVEDIKATLAKHLLKAIHTYLDIEPS